MIIFVWYMYLMIISIFRDMALVLSIIKGQERNAQSSTPPILIQHSMFTTGIQICHLFSVQEKPKFCELLLGLKIYLIHQLTQ